MTKTIIPNIYISLLGQPIDGPENGIPLDPWSIPMNVCENFRPIEVRKVEVPHTASIQVIYYSLSSVLANGDHEHYSS